MSEERYPEDRRYHPEHDWAQIEGDIAAFGITWFAQDALGDIVFFDPPDAGARIEAGGSYGELESVKAVSDLVAPLTGEVTEINQEVIDQPELVNSDPYAAWLIKIRLDDVASVDQLLTSADYVSGLTTSE